MYDKERGKRRMRRSHLSKEKGGASPRTPQKPYMKRMSTLLPEEKEEGEYFLDRIVSRIQNDYRPSSAFLLPEDALQNIFG